MNKTETLAFNLLKERGYKEKDIIFNSNKTPDFMCNDGKRFEVKFLYGNQLLFSKLQILVLKADDLILVFNRDRFISEFKWKDRRKSVFEIKIVDYGSDNKIIKINKETQKKLNDMKIHPRQSYEEVIQMLIINQETIKNE